MRLKIKHNMEVAHRLLNDSGKCQQIHGHGMQVELLMLCAEGQDGMAVNGSGYVMEFGRLKKEFRTYIDTHFDHHLLLNQADPWAEPLAAVTYIEGDEVTPDHKEYTDETTLPGLVTVPGDPTVENLAKWIAEWACGNFKVDTICRIDETLTNGAEAMYFWNGFKATFAEGAR